MVINIQTIKINPIMNERTIRQSYQTLKQTLSTPARYPHTNSVLNVPSFVKENEQLYARLLKQLKQLRKGGESVHKREVKIKTTPLYMQNMISSKTTYDDDHLNEWRGKNQELRAEIRRVKDERARKAVAEQPVIREKRRQLKDRNEEVSKLNQTSKQLKRATQKEELLELYEQKCRECESLRVVNNQLSEELKKLINDLNKVTGTEENPNMFLLSVGIR